MWTATFIINRLLIQRTLNETNYSTNTPPSKKHVCVCVKKVKNIKEPKNRSNVGGLWDTAAKIT